MTSGSSLMSIPRAAMSVAISTRQRPARKSFMARSRAPCDLSPWMARPSMPALVRMRAMRSAPCLVREKTSTEPSERSRSRLMSRSFFSAFSANMTLWLIVSTTDAGGVTVTCTGSWSIELASVTMSEGIVAEKKSVCRSLGSSGSIRLMSWMKPMSSIRSASSSTKKRMSESETYPCPIRSSRRPGVATSRSTPRCRASTCGRWLTPPKITQWRRSV